MRRKRLLLAPALLLVVTQTGAASPDAATLIGAIEGVYKHRFANAMIVPGSERTESYQSEDVVEIVRHDEQHIYVRARLQYANGHVCSIAGMARHENGRFVYRDPEPALVAGPSCTLTVGVTGDKLTLTDRLTADGAATCSQHCGARGSLTYDIARSARRPIRYLPRLKASREYAQARDELLKAPVQAPR